MTFWQITQQTGAHTTLPEQNHDIIFLPSPPSATYPCSFPLYLHAPAPSSIRTCPAAPTEAMSEAPRVELPNTDTDFDHIDTNGTTNVSEMDADMSSHSNGNGTSDLQNSAIKAKDGILESRVSRSTRIRS